MPTSPSLVFCHIKAKGVEILFPLGQDLQAEHMEKVREISFGREGGRGKGRGMEVVRKAQLAALLTHFSSSLALNAICRLGMPKFDI